MDLNIERVLHTDCISLSHIRVCLMSPLTESNDGILQSQAEIRTI
jgi:hypothetical protein